jgi:ribosomal protein S18 acetylase RimI-like enzyme
MPALSFLVRVAQPSDAPNLATLARRTFYEAFASTVAEDSMQKYLVSSFAPEQVASEIADPDTVFLLADSDGVLLGYSKLHFGAPMPEVQGTSPVKLWRLYTLATNQSTGVGKALVTASVTHATTRGGKTLWLTVNNGNHRAIAFYERNGFVTTGETTFDLGGETHYDFLMEKAMTP